MNELLFQHIWMNLYWRRTVITYSYHREPHPLDIIEWYIYCLGSCGIVVWVSVLGFSRYGVINNSRQRWTSFNWSLNEDFTGKSSRNGRDHMIMWGGWMRCVWAHWANMVVILLFAVYALTILFLFNSDECAMRNFWQHIITCNSFVFANFN